MIYALYVALVIALPAAIGAQIVCKYINRQDPIAGFTLLLLAAVPAFGYAFYFPGGMISPFRFDIGGPGALVIGALLGGTIGLRQRWADLDA